MTRTEQAGTQVVRMGWGHGSTKLYQLWALDVVVLMKQNVKRADEYS